MRTCIYFFAILLTIGLFAVPTWSQKDYGSYKKVEIFSPDPNLYEKISKKTAEKLKNNVHSAHYKVSIKSDSVSGEKDNKGMIPTDKNTNK